MIMVIAPHRASQGRRRERRRGKLAARREEPRGRRRRGADRDARRSAQRTVSAGTRAGDGRRVDQEETYTMPKMKPHTGMGKRVKVTGKRQAR